MSLAITITKDEIAPVLKRIPATVNSAGLVRACGRGAGNSVRGNFARLQATRPNQMGWKRQNYWAQAARSVAEPVVSGLTATIAIAQPGIGPRYFGPTTITPVAAKNLALPATEDAYGTRPRDARWTGRLEFAMVGGRRKALVFVENAFRIVAKGKRAGQRVLATGNTRATAGAGEVLFWLVPRVVIQQDRGVLPTEDQLLDAAAAAGNDYLLAQLDRGGPAA